MLQLMWSHRGQRLAQVLVELRSFERLRRHARSNNLLLADVAREVVAGFDPAERPRLKSKRVSAPDGGVTGETNRDVRTDALAAGDEETG